MRAMAAVAAVAMLLTGTVTAGRSPDTRYRATIRRTEHGIPHILAANYASLGFGYGYAFAQDNLCVLADIVVTLRGDRSRYFGPDASSTDALGPRASNLDSD